MYWKMVWDIEQFDRIQRSMPDLDEPLAFAAINVCIAATSLRDWTVASFMAKRRLQKKPVTKGKVLEHIYRHVPQQGMCEAIANTAKHSRLQEANWRGGHVRIDVDESTEDDPGGRVLRHIHEDGAYTSLGLNAFMAMEQCWWGELQNLGFAFPRIGPEWWQRNVRSKFGLSSNGEI